MRFARSVALATTLGIIASLFTVTVALGHHVNTIDIEPSCVTQDAVVSITHNIHSGHLLEYEVFLNGSLIDSDKRLPDSRYSTEVTVKDVVPYGQGTMYARARALYASGHPESSWVTKTVHYDCPRKTGTLKAVLSKPKGDPFYYVKFTNIGDTPGKGTWSYVSAKTGKRVWLRTPWLAPGCSYTSSWRNVQSYKQMWAQENQPVSRRLWTRRAAKPDYYGSFKRPKNAGKVVCSGTFGLAG